MENQKTLRQQALQNGKIIVRSQITGKGKWRIVKLTPAGGWSKHIPREFDTMDEADIAILDLKNDNPNVMTEDELD